MRYIFIIALLYIVYRFFVKPAMALNETYKKEQEVKRQKAKDREDDYVDYEEVDK
jgi:hypothetical protein